MREEEPLKEFIPKYEKLKILPQNVRDFIITLITESIQKKIASLVQQSHEVRKKAKELLEKLLGYYKNDKSMSKHK